MAGADSVDSPKAALERVKASLYPPGPAATLVDELTIIIAPVILGAGRRLFDGFGGSLELEHLGVRQSPFATFIDYRVQK